jgi:oligopeptide transport system substrate-binding protein
LHEARRILAEAGYPHGIDPATNKPLVLFFDANSAGPDIKALFDWYRKQFDKLGISLVVRSSDYNRFQEKMNQGNAQIFSWGWNADYPDPENFLFLLYGPNSKAGHQGENAANYSSPKFDRLFAKMRALPDGELREGLVRQIVAIVREDAPWVWGFHPQGYALSHQWLSNVKPNLMARNTLKYMRLDPVLRTEMRQQWNSPRVWPVVLVIILFAICAIGAVLHYRKRQSATAL